MITEQEERVLIDLLSRHDTPTEAVRRALNAQACEITLTYLECDGELTIIVRDAQLVS